MPNSGWELPKEALEWLTPRIAGKVVVELGSGAGSVALAKLCGRLISVEHDPKFVSTYSASGMIVLAPIEKNWYARQPVSLALSGNRPDVLIVDGPPGMIGRAGLLDNLDLFPVRVPMLIDDVHRQAERDLALELASRRKQTLCVHMLPSGRAFATIGWSV